MTLSFDRSFPEVSSNIFNHLLHRNLKFIVNSNCNLRRQRMKRSSFQNELFVSPSVKGTAKVQFCRLDQSTPLLRITICGTGMPFGMTVPLFFPMDYASTHNTDERGLYLEQLYSVSPIGSQNFSTDIWICITHRIF